MNQNNLNLMPVLLQEMEGIASFLRTKLISTAARFRLPPSYPPVKLSARGN